jgi:hypothetical protein
MLLYSKRGRTSQKSNGKAQKAKVRQKEQVKRQSANGRSQKVRQKSKSKGKAQSAKGKTEKPGTRLADSGALGAALTFAFCALPFDLFFGFDFCLLRFAI